MTGSRLSILVRSALLVLFSSVGLGQTPAPDFQMPPATLKDVPKQCHLSSLDHPKAGIHTLAIPDAKGTLFLQGGGEKESVVSDTLFSEMAQKVIEAQKDPDRKKIPVILSANEWPAAKDAKTADKTEEENEVLKWYGYWKTRLKGLSTTPVFTESPGTGSHQIDGQEIFSNSANSTNLSALDNASVIVVEGGDVFGYDHLVGLKISQSLKKAYERGAFIYMTSAGTNYSGLVNTGRLEFERSSDSKRDPVVADGFGVVNFAMMSHVLDPDFMADSGSPQNPFANLDVMNQFVSKHQGDRRFPVIGLPKGTWGIVKDGIMTIGGPNPDERIYVLDPRHPSREKCEYAYLLPGDRYDLRTGEVLPGDPAKEPSRHTSGTSPETEKARHTTP